MRARSRTCFQLGAAGVAFLCACSHPSEPGISTPINAMTAENHASKFPITSGAHAGADCNSCHGDFDTFSKFSCTGCHAHDQAPTDAKHARVSGYAYSSSSCYTCHRQGTAKIDHSPFFPIGTGTMHDAACSSCHSNPSTPTDVTTISCIGCHNNSTTPP